MNGSPELSMVLEKAIVLLNGKEFSALRRILAEYEATEINIDTFADSLLQLIKDQEKVKHRLSKGQLISKCLLSVIVSNKKTTKVF